MYRTRGVTAASGCARVRNRTRSSGAGRDARDWLAAFDRALGELDPALAALGHTGLLMSGHYPHLEQAGKRIDDLTKDRGVENWSDAARTIVAEAIRREKSTEASRPSD